MSTARNGDRQRHAKATSARPTLVVIPLTKHSKQVEDVLLRLPLAQSLVERGINVKPEWACGAKVFVEGFGQGDAGEFRVWFGQRVGLGPHHVVVHLEDEASVLDALRQQLPAMQLATVKLGGVGGSRTMAPQDNSSEWFRCSSLGAHCDISEEFTCPEGCPIIVRNTFVHFPQVSSIEFDAPRKAHSG